MCLISIKVKRMSLWHTSALSCCLIPAWYQLLYTRFGNNNDNNAELRDYEGLCLIPVTGHIFITDRQHRVCQVLTSVNSCAFLRRASGFPAFSSYRKSYVPLYLPVVTLCLICHWKQLQEPVTVCRKFWFAPWVLGPAGKGFSIICSASRENSSWFG